MNKQNNFIKKATERHCGKYDYSKVEYINAKTKVCIICPEHGEFWQTPQNHLKMKGCPICSNEKRRKTTEKFIEEAKSVHGNKYDYSKVKYMGAFEKVCIICPEHGEFWQIPNVHINGGGCPKCSQRSYPYTVNEFIEKARQIHGDKYDYSKVEYKDNKTKVCIICPEHGEFWMRPQSHLNGQNCPKCVHRSYVYDKNEWIELARAVHGDKYDYSKVEYKNNHTKVCIICPEHGEFWQTPTGHLNSCGCPKCGKKSVKNKIAKSQDMFINDSKNIFGDWFDYSKVNYINNKTKVCLICKKHGEFWVRPDGHLTQHIGCPQCSAEKNVNETILFEHIKNRFKNSNFFHSKRGLKNFGLYEIDIYDADKKIGIEYQGDEHFVAIDFFNGDAGLIDTIKRDKNKIKLCKENGIKLFHFTYNKKYCKDKINYKVYTDEEELFNELDRIYNENKVEN